MRNTGKRKVVITGCGNVAWHIAKKLSASGQFDIEVYNHRENRALAEFRKLPHCKTHPTLATITASADFYIICVSDKFIADVASHIRPSKPGALLVHTSGSASIKELGDRVHLTGVLYPLQSFSRNDDVSWKGLPILIECDGAAKQNLQVLAKIFSSTVVQASGKERLKMHLAAVFVNNFANALFVAANDIVGNDKKETPGFQLLFPLIEKTAEKMRTLEPVKAQTGPAKRGDKAVMKKHLAMLLANKDYTKLYKLMSNIISTQQAGYAEL
jgi:predicted short-subunit dehydrogenase-like oxidoreductase (DUF2520 family)